MRREVLIFLIVGSLSVLIDFLTYRSLLWINLVDINIAKTIGFLSGTIFAYFANRIWTFGHKIHAAGSVYRFALLYMITLGANVTTNNIILTLFDNNKSAIQIAFLIATGLSAVLNFVGMKLFAFKGSEAI